jgi:hypothetical protein
MEDWDFVCREAPSLRKVFLRERKALTVLWLKETHRQMAEIFHFHRIAIRGEANLQVATELKVAVNYAVFLLTFAAALSLVHLVGPFRLRKLTTQVFEATGRVSAAVEGALSALDSSVLARIKDDLSRQRASVV